MARIFSWIMGGLLSLQLAPALPAQAPPVRDAAQLQMALDQLQVVGSVLYLAAHPDDENPALLAYFSKGRHLRTSYLSLTRGGGGQNRIGTERGDALAALRTQELLAARRLDGAEQYFTRAVDFGYSKTPEETLAIWGRDAVLADVVGVIRKLRPDVIVTRFPPTRGRTHGHHTASAILAVEAFQAAADPARFPEQLAWTRPWQATRLVWNRYAPEPGPAAGGPSVDVGAYDPLLGQSYAELAALSHSQHRSQAFGAVARRGPRIESFEPLAGRPAKADLFEGIDLTWGRVQGGAEVARLLARARRDFRPERPAAALPALLEAKAGLDRLPQDPLVAPKRAELLEAIRCAAGLWVEAIADRQAVAAGDPFAVEATVIARGDDGVALAGWELAPPLGAPAPGRPKALPLALNQPLRETFRAAFPPDTPCSQPTWLGPGASAGLHAGGPPRLAFLAEDPPALSVTFHLAARGVPFDLTAPVRYRFKDQVLGERYQPLVVTPPVMVTFAEPVQVLAAGATRELSLVARAGRKGAAGRLRLQASGGWRVEPAEFPFALAEPGDEARFSARLTAPAEPATGTLTARAEPGDAPARGLMTIDYPHVSLQTLFPPARVSLAGLDLRLGGTRIGYVNGCGDEIPAALRPLGYRVDLLGDAELACADLSGYDAIVVGIRAYNARPALAQLNPRLLEYVARGGTEIVLYSVDQGLVLPRIGPFPFRISATRVTDEDAEMTFLAPDHPVLNHPNRITQADFQGWVQERGTYFAEDWDARFVPVFALHDPGEPPAAGSLIVAPYGKGQFAYTGLAFFRQLPEGVPGAYRLFANLLALGGAP